MNIRPRVLLPVAALVLSLLAGCAGASTAIRAPETAEETVEHRLDSVENKLENAIEKAVRSSAATLSVEEAQTIALNHAGLTGEEVQRPRAEPELRDRIPHYDIEFRHGHLEYEYEIHAETGEVLSLEKDR